MTNHQKHERGTRTHYPRPDYRKMVSDTDAIAESRDTPQTAPGDTLADELAALVESCSEPVTCSCGSHWGPLRAAQVASRALSRAVAEISEGR